MFIRFYTLSIIDETNIAYISILGEICCGIQMVFIMNGTTMEIKKYSPKRLSCTSQIVKSSIYIIGGTLGGQMSIVVEGNYNLNMLFKICYMF